MNRKGTILVVEDSPLFRAFLTNYLTGEYDFEVEEINSARGLQQYLARGKPEHLLLIVLDIYLPDGNGLEVIKEYKEKYFSDEQLPFIVISGNITKEAAAAAVKAGAKDVLTKPVNTYRLSQKIDQILSDKYRLKEPRSITDYYQPITMELKRAHRGEYSLGLLLTGILEGETLKPLHEVNYRSSVRLEKELSDSLQGIMRETDTRLHLSTSEILYILPFADAEGVQVVREKIINTIKENMKEMEEKIILVSGAATYPQDGENPEQLIYTLESSYKSNHSFTG